MINKERVIFMKSLFISLMVVFVFLSGCSGKLEEVMKVENKNFSGRLFIQKTEDQTSSEEMTKMVTDKQKIEKILTMVEGLKVKETDTDYMLKEMKAQDSYSFSFAEGEKMESGKPAPYSFVVLNNGTFFFTHKDVNSPQKPRMTIEKHKDLLKEMKDLLEMDF
jgi:translation initiation factor 1 (eIF-1/SUI1)